MRQNDSSLHYFFPKKPLYDVTHNWIPRTSKCRKSSNCWCYFVHGSQDKDTNPRGSDICEARPTWTAFGYHGLGTISNCTESERTKPCHEKCTSGKGSPCLYTMMGPAKLLSLVAIARAAGVTHIVEEGRAGGLSAYMLHLLGFNVTSVDYMPIYEVSSALKAWAPGIALYDGDGHELVPSIIDAFGPEVAARTLVMFDGEKRIGAYNRTYMLVRDKVAVGAFDDSDISSTDGLRINFASNPFHDLLNGMGEVWWESNGTHLQSFLERELPTYEPMFAAHPAELPAIGKQGSLRQMPGSEPAQIPTGPHRGTWIGAYLAVVGGAWKKRRKAMRS